MVQPAIVTSARATFVHRAFYWWLAQVKHVLPPTIFFLCWLQLDPLDWTKHLILREYGIDFSGLVIATLAALLIGKAVLVTDNLPFMHRFDGAPLILVQKLDLLGVCIYPEAYRSTDPFSRGRRRDWRLPDLHC